MPLMAELVGESPGIGAVRSKLSQLLGHHQDRPRRLPPVLLQGETGTGKGLLAHLIHREGPRRQGPFVDINCAAIPESLLEAELFGFERGAFTDARHAKPGLFQAAHGGILFLDEIALLPPALQPKLLTVIEEQAVRRLGSIRSEPVDVWIVAASSEELANAVNTRGFRKDLYHRLAVLTVSLPPLRERREDILSLTEYFLTRACADYGLPSRTLARDARAALLAHGWPGNVRELSNVLERAALLANAPIITVPMLGLPAPPVTEPTPTTPAAALQDALDLDDAVTTVECQRMLDALHATNWNVVRAAARLGISRNRLRYRIEKHGLRPPASRQRSTHRQPPAPAFTREAAGPAETPTFAPLRWERRHIALLRADLVFDSQTDVPPDTSSALERLVEKVRTFGGRVQELGPRALVAAFGLEPVEDAPSRAALAAIAIQKATARALAADLSYGEMRLAVHVALPMVSQLGGHTQIDPDSMAEAATTLKSLIARGEAGAIVASGAAVPFLERRFELARADQPAGTAPRVYRLERREPTGFGLGGSVLSRFVGRDRELMTLADRLAQAERGRGQVVGILGEPGIGKSRLVYEFTRSPGLRTWRTLGGRAVSYGTSTPYLLIVDLLKHYFQIEDGEAPSRIRDQVTDKVIGLDPALEPHVPAFLSLLDVGVEDPRWQLLEPLQRRERTLDAIRRLIIRESHTQPLCLVFEDLHWIDAETQAAIDRLIASLPAARILLLLTYRQEYPWGWGSKTCSTQLSLDPLAPELIDKLLTTLVGTDAELSPLKRLLIERTEGNPFFLEESVRALVEGQALVGEPGAYRLGRSVDAISTPATVQAVLTARIDQLPTTEAMLLQTAAVIGTEVPFTLLQAIAELPAEKTRRSLEHLQAAEFLYEQSVVPDLIFRFKHGVIQDVAYRSLLGPRRKELHGAIGRAIEKLYADRLEEHAPLLAYHYAHSDEIDRAREYAVIAGDRAARLFANAEATTYYEQALGLILTQPASPARQQSEIDTVVKLAAVGLSRQDVLVRDRMRLEAARRMAEDLGDEPRLAQVLYWLGRISYVLWQPPTAIEYAAASLEIAERLGDKRLAAPPVNLMGRVYWQQSEYAKASQWLERSIEQMRQLGNKTEEATAAGFAGVALAYLGQFERAIDCANHGLKVAAEIQNPFAEAASYLDRAVVRGERGEADGAFADFEKAREIAERVGDVFRIYVVKFFEGRARTMAGDVERGCALIEESLELGARIGTRFALAWPKAFLAHALSALGKTAAALPLCQEAIRLATDTGDRFPYAFAQRILAEGLLRIESDDTTRADHAFGEAFRTMTEIGTRPELARTYVSYAQFLGARGDRRRARDLMSAAIAMFDDMGMTRDRERAARTQVEGERDESPC